MSEVRYNPYGTIRYSWGALPTDRLFTGQRREAGIGLYDYQARFYDPELGRFISPDSIVPDPGKGQAFNRYSYVYNNPLKYTDPTGHCAQDDQQCHYIEDKFGVILEGDNWTPDQLVGVHDGLEIYRGKIGTRGFDRYVKGTRFILTPKLTGDSTDGWQPAANGASSYIELPGAQTGNELVSTVDRADFVNSLLDRITMGW